MFCTYKDLELALFPCLLIFFQPQNYCFWAHAVARFPTLPRPIPASHSFLYFFFILFALSWVGVFARRNLIFLFLVRLFGGPMFCVLITLMLPGKLFLLILLYLAAKDVPLGKVMCNGTARLLSTIFCLIVSSFYCQKLFLIYA